MNIFALSNDPHEAAIWQHDRHVVKMILESAQMLSTATRAAATNLDSYIPDFDESLEDSQLDLLYKSTHVNHPCNIWLRDSWANFAWLTVHLDSLVGEYHRRFRKHHATDGLRWLFNGVVANHLGVDRFWTRDSQRHHIVDPAILNLASQHTPFAVCMPYRVSDPVVSYQYLYCSDKIFQQHVKWTRCDAVPDFIVSMAQENASRYPRIQERVEQLVTLHREQVAAGWDSTIRPVRIQTPRSLVPIDYASLPRLAKITKFGVKSK